MFCGDCGKTIADNLSHCPHCGVPTGVVVSSTAAGAAPVAAPMVRRPVAEGSAPSRLTRAEQAVYFRLARGFSWFLLIVISLGMVGVFMLLLPVVSQVAGSSTEVSAKDLTQAMASSRSVAEEAEGEDLNPAEMARLDELAYEIIRLLPAEARPSESIDTLRGHIKNSVSGLAESRKAQGAILMELRDDLLEIPEAQRSKALEVYFGVKAKRIQADKAKKAEAQASLVLLGSFMLSGVALLTFITMILVLLSIERNTRWKTA